MALSSLSTLCDDTCRIVNEQHQAMAAQMASLQSSDCYGGEAESSSGAGADVKLLEPETPGFF
jgi:hypothetical protein